MSIREVINAIANNEEITAEMVETAKAELVKMDERNAKRAQAKAVRNAEVNNPIKEHILSALADGAKVASELAIECQVSTQKISALAKQLSEDGKVVISERKVKGGRAVKEYALAE